MAEERFQRRKYLHQLRSMQWEFVAWRKQYLKNEKETPAAWLAGRYARRAAALELALDDILAVIRRIEDLPRLA